jgi:NAD(P)-dependent dehydrogenase (short-subunit alcohol dehydrogenase family)
MESREDVIVTGASRGIGRALVRALATTSTKKSRRLVLVARDRPALESLAREVENESCPVEVVPGDLSSVAGAASLGDRLASLTTSSATLVHNAGIWPSKRVLTSDGLETAFAVNVVGPLVMQAPLLDAKRVARILVVGAGAMIKGRFDPARTPTGKDFSALRTYCSTKLAFAIAMREVAAKHPDVDVLVLHPGVVRTDLGARSGLLGWILDRVKRRWESPDVCAERLARVLDRERWSPAGAATWQVETTAEPWPQVACDAASRAAVVAATERFVDRQPSRGRMDSTG